MEAGLFDLNRQLEWLAWSGLHVTGWKLIGYTGALMFGARWLVQFVATRRAGRPVIPRLFWYMSVVGSVMTLSYFLFSAKQDSVGVLQNLFPTFVDPLQRSPVAIHERYFIRDDVHWNEAGHALVADQVAEVVLGGAR